MYLLKFEDNNFNFLDDNKGFEKETKEISNELYIQIKEQIDNGKQYRIKNMNGATLEEIFEEYTPEPFLKEPSELDKLKAENESMKQSIAELTVLVTSLIGGGV